MGGFAGLALSSLVSKPGYRRSPESETMMETVIARPRRMLGPARGRATLYRALTYRL